uniref:Uncharacterized protein LOC105050816 n=1 Tax=Elaeis guineensis var. tenera TaxID=51953 RepID=A0A6J0PL23_ELAGV|nr:uncharacterized protein LOC105050816 [Elaeis guineensis]
MEWWQRMLVPVKRALVAVAVAAHMRARKDEGGILKLHNDVQSCGYRDVQVMWEILQGSDLELSHSPESRTEATGQEGVGVGGPDPIAWPHQQLRR